MTKKISISDNFIVLFDELDFELVNHFKWRVTVSKSGNKYAIATLKLAPNKYKVIKMHRLILGLENKDFAKLNVF